MNLIFLFIFSLLGFSSVLGAKKSKASKAKTSDSLKDNKYSLWSNLYDKKLSGSSYLIQPNDKDPVSLFMKDLFDVIYTKQHPSSQECLTNRFLVIQMSSASFEGTGSLLKQMLLSVAIAMHSDRTLIWGLGYPFMFEHSKELWDGEDNDALNINDEVLNCTQPDPAAGPFGCFFEPLTTCGLEHLSPHELIEFSHNAYNESGRAMISEIRKGVALYHPPENLFEFLLTKRKYSEKVKSDILKKRHHIWAGAVAAYVFRLKPSLLSSFSKKFEYIFSGQESIWGVHVRHGDLKALSNVYSYKDVFEFDDYFDAAIQVSHRQKKSPSRLFVATDSTKADSLEKIYLNFMKSKAPSAMITKKKINDVSLSAAGDDDDDEYNDGEDDYDEEEEEEDDEEDEDEAEDSSPSNWFGGKAPTLKTINNTKRYRTEHGSHTVAANGGCLRDDKYSEKGMRCSLNYDAIVHYQSIDEHRSVPRSKRLMRVLLESIEDIYLLSRCETLIAQGSSHFSTLAGLLILAKTKADQFKNTINYLDEESIEKGFIPTALLHGMNLLNGTNGVDESDFKSGLQRWLIHTNSFISGYPNQPDMYKYNLGFNPWDVENRIKLIDGLPQIHEKLFYLEAKTWLNKGNYKPVLPGHCPGPIKKKDNPNEYIPNTANLGVEHLGLSHQGQAMQCWSNSLAAIQEIKKIEKNDHLDELEKIVTGNMGTVRIWSYSEMAVNENKNTREYLDYTERYMKKTYDGIFDKKKKSRNGEDDGEDGEISGGKQMYTLEDANEEIAKLEEKLVKLKGIREKLVEASKMLATGQLDTTKVHHMNELHKK